MQSTAPYINHGLPQVQWVNVTPAIASDWLEQWNNGNRNKRPAHIARIARDMENGNYLVTGESIKFDTGGRLIDGQHRLSAIVKANRPAWLLVVTELDPDVQVVIDANAKRSGGDALKFKQLGAHYSLIAAAARIGISRDTGRLILSSERASATPTNTEVVEWVGDNADILDAASLADSYRRAIPARPAVLAYSAMILRRIDPALADEFFESIRDMRTSGKGDPRLALYKFLSASHDGKGHPEAQIGFGLFAIFHAWNTWRDGKTLLSINPYSKNAKDERGNFLPREIPEPR